MSRKKIKHSVLTSHDTFDSANERALNLSNLVDNIIYVIEDKKGFYLDIYVTENNLGKDEDIRGVFMNGKKH